MDDSRDRGSERRQLTVVFCDIVDCTGLSERCDPEDLSEILAEYQAICTRCIKEGGGNVVCYIGDGIRSEFGYPLTTENEAASAVRAGLTLLRAVEQLSERSTALLNEPLRLRIGVHTGVAVVGKARSGRSDDAAEIVGETPNIAFRLQEVASPNSLVISGSTQSLVRGKFHLRPLGLHSLKGLSRKIQVFQVLGETTENTIVRSEDYRNTSPLVDRIAEMGQLLQAWDRIKNGRGQTVEITGEAGIGKSRLARELIGKIGLAQESIVALHASAQHQNTPLYPVIRTLEQKVGVRKDESADANSSRLGEFFARVPASGDEQHALIGQLLGLPPRDSANSIVFDAQELRRKTREIVVHLLTLHARAGPGLILVEDFHWADPSTIEIVKRIADSIGNLPILLLLTSRTETIGGGPSIQRLTLQRLPEESRRALACAVVPRAQLSRQLLQEIITRSDGVPLFVEELAAAALETGQVDAGPSVSVGTGGHGVPSALYDSLMLRLDRLGDAKAIAQLASVIGRNFSHQLLAAVAAELGAPLDPGLARLLESGLINIESNEAEQIYAFKHTLVRDVSYYSLLRRHRRELHSRVADAIEIYLPEIANKEPAYLAHHLSEAGFTLRAVHMWLRAAKQSAERSANLEAVAQLGTALEQIQKLPNGLERDKLELETQIALIGPTISLQGFAAAAVADVSGRAIELSRALDNDPHIFPALYARWSYLRVVGRVNDAGALAKDFLTLAEQKGTRTNRMVGHRLLGTSLLDGETVKAREHLVRATKLYDRGADQATAIIYGTDVQVTSLSNLCIIDWLLGRVTDALDQGQAAMELAAQLRHAHTLGYAFAHVCMFHTLERDVQTVEPLARKFLAGAVQQELPLWIAVAQTFLGWCEFESGRLESGIVLLEKQRDFLRAAHLVYWLPTYLCWLAEAYLRAGDLSESKACLRRARDVFDGGGNYWYEVECRRIEACVAARTHTDNPAHAEGAFREALGLARQRGQRGFALRTAHYLAQHLAASGRQQTAHDVLQGELRFFHNQPDRGDRADARALLQSLQTAMRG